MIQIEPEPPGIASSREVLLDQAFGPARLAKTAERLREGRLPAGAAPLASRHLQARLRAITITNAGIYRNPSLSFLQYPISGIGIQICV